jgi:glc operon protein GlcG
MKTKFSLSLADAKRIAEAAEAEASRNGWSVVIAVVDDGGHLVLLQRLDGTQAASSEIAVHKARTAALFKRPTKALEEVVASGRVAMLSLPGVTPVEGGVPIVYRGDIVGAIGVSGVQSFQDGIVAKAGADSIVDAGL